MKIPDRIYTQLDPFGIMYGDWSEKPSKGENNVEYIRKDALVQHITKTKETRAHTHKAICGNVPPLPYEQGYDAALDDILTEIKGR